KRVAAAGCSTWSPNQGNVTAASLKEAQGLRLKVIPWTVNERPDMQRLIQMGVDGIITDYPNRLRAVMAAKDIPLPPAVPARGGLVRNEVLRQGPAGPGPPTPLILL